MNLVPSSTALLALLALGPNVLLALPPAQEDADIAQLEATARRLYQSDQLGAASKLYEELAERASGPRRSEALSLAAWLAYLDEQPERARSLLGRLRAEDPDLELSPDRFDEPFLELDRALRDAPAPRSTPANAAELDHALSLLSSGDWDAARGVLRQILAEDPTSPATLLALARLERRAGETDRALEILERVEQLLASGAQTGAGLDRATVAEELGLTYLRARRLEPAIDSLRRATELDPGSATAWRNLAVALQRAERVDLAVQAYRHALQLRPDPTVRTDLARLLSSRQRWGEAATVLLAGAEAGELDAAQLLELGRALRGDGQLEPARRWLRQTLELARGDGQLEIAGQSATELAYVELQAGAPAAARDIARTAVELTPDDVEAHHALGLALIATNEPAAATAELQLAQDRAPRRADIANNLGRALFAVGEYSAAAEQFRTAIELDPLLAAAAENLRLAENRRDADEAAPPVTDAPYPGVTVTDTVHRASGRPAAEVLVVEPRSAADRAGLEAGDLILRAARRGLRNADDLRRLLRDLQPGQSIRLDLVRGATTLSVELSRP